MVLWALSEAPGMDLAILPHQTNEGGEVKIISLS